MRYHDPERPRLQGDEGLPLFIGLPRRVVLPGLHVAPRGADLSVSAFFPLASGGASRREIVLHIDDFPPFWFEWLADPELTACERFNWEYGAPTKPTLLAFEDLF